MASPTLVVSNPPHRQVDLDAAAALLQLDVYATRLKSVFVAPEIMDASNAEHAEEFAVALRSAGFNVAVLPGIMLARVPWPAPVSALTLDVSSVQVTIGEETLRIANDAEVLCVYCRPPGDRMRRPHVDIVRAVEGGDGPTIAGAIHQKTIMDLYFRSSGALRRATILPDLLKQEGDRLLKDLRARLKGLMLDDRLAGIRARAPWSPAQAISEGPERRRYSFGTQMLSEALTAISPKLGSIPQYELGSRLAYALSPLASAARS